MILDLGEKPPVPTVPSEVLQTKHAQAPSWMARERKTDCKRYTEKTADFEEGQKGFAAWARGTTASGTYCFVFLVKFVYIEYIYFQINQIIWFYILIFQISGIHSGQIVMSEPPLGFPPAPPSFTDHASIMNLANFYRGHSM